MKRKVIPYYELCALTNNDYFINRYDLSYKNICEMERYWKEFFFDLLDELYQANLTDPLVNIANKRNDLFIYLKNNYKMLIEKYRLKIDIKYYVEINDYIPFSEWEVIKGNIWELDTESGQVILTMEK